MSILVKYLNFLDGHLVSGIIMLCIIKYVTCFADGDAIKALETRQGDKQARDFLKKQKQKTPTKQQFFSLGWN